MGRYIPSIILDKDEIKLFLDSLGIDERAVVGEGIGMDGIGLSLHFLDSAFGHEAIVYELFDERVELGACNLTLGHKLVFDIKGIALVVLISLCMERFGSVLQCLGEGFVVVVFEKLLIASSPLGGKSENIVPKAELCEKRVIAGNRLGVDSVGSGVVFVALLRNRSFGLMGASRKSQKRKSES